MLPSDRQGKSTTAFTKPSLIGLLRFLAVLLLAGYIGNFGQLPAVMGLPVYVSIPKSALSDLGRAVYQPAVHPGHYIYSGHAAGQP